MSILQEYEEIRKSMPKRQYDNIEKFLNRHPQYLLSDVYYRPEVYKEFEKWQIRYEKNHLEYLYKGLSNDPFIRLTLEDLMIELEENPKLKEHVLSYAKEHLKENTLSDKAMTLRAITSMNPDVLYNHDTEVREKFCECYKGGIKSLSAEWNAQAKQLKSRNEKEKSR